MIPFVGASGWTRDGFSSFGPGARGSLIAYTAILFAVFFVYTFPASVIVDRLVNRIAADSGWEIGYDEARFVPWSGFRLSEVTLEPPAGSGPRMRIDALVLSPSLRTFLGYGFRRGSFSGETYGGHFSGDISWDAGLDLALSWSELDLGVYSPLADLIAGQWGGTSTGELRLRRTGAGLEGDARAELRDLSLIAGDLRGFKIPDLRFRTGTAEIAIGASRVEVRAFRLAGPELEGNLRAQVFVREPAAASLVTGTLGIRPIPGVAPLIENALRALSGNRAPRDGAYQFTISGSLGAMRLS